MNGVHFSNSTKRWRATGYFNKKQLILYEGKSKELAERARRKFDLSQAPTKPCISCGDPVTNRSNILRCRPCANKHRKVQINKHNARRKIIPEKFFAFDAHNHWPANKGNVLADCFYEV